MATRAKLSYLKLRNEGPLDDDDAIGYVKKRSGRVIGQVIRNWSRRHRKVKIKRKVKIGIPSLKKFLRRRRKVIVCSWSKVLKRLKDNQCQFRDLFAGNYMFMQVVPISFKYLDHKPRRQTLDHGFSSKYCLPKIP